MSYKNLQIFPFLIFFIFYLFLSDFIQNHNRKQQFDPSNLNSSQKCYAINRIFESKIHLYRTKSRHPPFQHTLALHHCLIPSNHRIDPHRCLNLYRLIIHTLLCPKNYTILRHRADQFLLSF